MPILMQCSIINSSYKGEEGGSIENDIDYSVWERTEGACYKKVVVTDGNRTQTQSILEYTGDTPSIDGVEKLNIVREERNLVWVLKKNKKGCVSKDPEDCQYWTKEEMPEIIDSYWEVFDTNKVKDFEVVELEFSKPSGSDYIEWREVICESDIDAKLIESIFEKIRENGLFVDKPIGNSKEQMMVELKEYQHKFNLPFGSLDFQTMDHLGTIVD